MTGKPSQFLIDIAALGKDRRFRCHALFIKRNRLFQLSQPLCQPIPIAVHHVGRSLHQLPVMATKGSQSLDQVSKQVAAFCLTHGDQSLGGLRKGFLHELFQSLRAGFIAL
ncbi:hypothetical protein D3C73_1354940 [compost metagenome]